MLPTAAHLPYAFRLQTPTTSRHALLDSALLPRFNSSGVVQFVMASRSVCPGDFGSGRFAPAGMLLPGGGSRLILRIMTPCTLTRSSRVGSLAFWSPYGDSPHTYHGAFTLRLTCPDGCRSALASGAVLSVLSYYCHTYGVGAYSHHDEADDNLADSRAIKKTRRRCEQQRHQGRSTDSHLYRHRIGSGGQVT